MQCKNCGGFCCNCSQLATPPPPPIDRRFWMIYVNGGQAPTTRHYSRDVARKEAERLAAHTGKKTYILVAEDLCSPVANVAWISLK